MKKKRILVVTTHALRDPLTEGLTLHFIKSCASEQVEFTLVTFEGKKLKPADSEIETIKSELLSGWNISWHPCTFHEGSVLNPKKFFSLLSSFFSLIFLNLRYKADHAFAICSPSAAAIYLMNLLRKTPFSVYAFEPHAELMAELGIWKKSGANFRILNFFERKSAQSAKNLMTGTDAMINVFRSWNVKAQLFKVPTGSDENLFHFDQTSRIHYRKKWGAENKTVVTYVGKFGGLYLSEELILFFASMFREDANLFFMVLTPNDHESVRNWFIKNGVPENAFTISISPLTELTQRLSACDLGVIAYADVPSRKYCSPTKAGNYLMSGLPYLVQVGTSEDDLLAKRHKVGIVIEDFHQNKAKETLLSLKSLLSENREMLASRCVQAGRDERSNTRAVEVWQKIISA